MSEPFFVTFLPRSGSSHLMFLLNSHPQISCDGETFSPRHAASGGALDGIPKVLRRLARIFDAPKMISGFKFAAPLQYDTFPLVLDILASVNAKCILIDRRDLVRGFISGRMTPQVAQATGGIKHNLTNNDILLQKIWVDINGARRAIDARAKHRERMIAVVKSRFALNYCLDYEDLVNNQDEQMASIFEFLGADPFANATTRSKKITPDDLSLIIENYDEFARAFGL